METLPSSEEAPEPSLTLRRAETLARQTIAALAESCRDSLQQSYRHLTNYGDDGAKSIKMRDLVGRFNIWTSNTGALAALHASLDYRLRDLPEEKELMIDHLQNMVELMNELLSLVSAGARRGLIKAAQEAQEAQDSQQDNQLHLEHVELPESTIDPEEDKKIDSMMSTLSLSLDSMHRFANVMRRASIYRQNAKAENFRLKDANGGDAEDDIRKLFDYWIRRDFSGPALSKTKADADGSDSNTAVVPGIEDKFKERLVKTMLLRRRRILYRRSRQVKLALHTAKPIKEHTPIVPIARPSNAGSAKKKEPTPSQKSKPSAPIFVPSIAPSMPNTATTLDPVVYKREAAKPSKVSMARTVAMTKGNKDMVPLPPRLPPGALEFVCPYCCLILPAKDAADNGAWAKHVMKDLDPYVCAFFPCEQGEHLFPNSAEWAAHMKQTHCVRWSCMANTHPPARFDTEDAYIGHMKTDHPGKFSDRQLPFIARSSKRPSKVIFEECPLCGMSNEEIAKKNSTSATVNNTSTNNGGSAMEDHVAHHLQYIALLSLPFPEDADDGDGRSVTSTASSQSGKGEAASRSTLKSEKHDLPPLPLPDLDDEPYFGPDPDPPIPEESDVPNVVDIDECTSLWVDVRRDGGHRAFGTVITEDEQRRDKVLETFVGRVDALREAELELERETITFPIVPPKPGTASHHAGPNGFWMLPHDRNREFQDRPDAIGFLTRHLQNPDSTGATSAFVAGPPGSGKSQLTLEFMYRQKDNNKKFSCLWIRSDSIGSMQTDFTKASVLLGLDNPYDVATKFNHVSAVHKYLSAEDRGPWVIVFDNWDDYLSEFQDGKDSTSWTTALKFADSASRLPNVAVIITSRIVALKPHLDTINRNHASTKRTPSKNYEGRLSITHIASVNDRIVKFLSTLGPGISLPLAKAYLVANPMSIEEYMHWYKEVEFAILSRNKTLEDITPTDVVCAVSLLAIANQNALACYYAMSMIGFDDNRAPIILLLPWDSPYEQMTAIHLLCHYGLASFSPSFSPRDPTYIRLNFVIHTSLILWAECVGFGYSDIIATLVARLAHLLPETPVPNPEKMWQRILPNIASVLNYAQDEGRPQTETERLLKYKYGAWLVYLKRFKEAKPVLEDALGDNTWNDMEYNSITMSIVALLGRVELLSQDGDIHEARVYLKRAFHYRQGALGLEHPDTYSVLSDLLLASKGRNHDDVHKLEGLMDHISDARNPTVYICTDCLVGPELEIRFDEVHSDDTMSSLLNLAQFYMNDDKWAAAETCLYHALGPIDQLIPIKDLRHKDRMLAQQGLRQLAVCIEAWIVLEDKEQYSGLSKTPKRLYDVAKPVTSTLRRLPKLAIVYSALDRLEDAINCQKRALDGWELLNGRDDPDTKEAEAALAATLENTDQSIVVEDLAYKWYWRFQRNSVAAEQSWLSPGNARSEEMLRDWVDRLTDGMERADESTDIGHFGSHLPDVSHPPSFRVQGHDDSVVFRDSNNERVGYRVVTPPPKADRPTDNPSSVSSIHISHEPNHSEDGTKEYSVVVEKTYSSSTSRSSSVAGRDGTGDDADASADEGAEESSRERREDIPDTEETPEAEERRSRERRRKAFLFRLAALDPRKTGGIRQEEPQIKARSEAILRRVAAENEEKRDAQRGESSKSSNPLAEEIPNVEETPEETEGHIPRPKVHVLYGEGIVSPYSPEHYESISRIRATDKSMISAVPPPDTQNDDDVRKSRSLESLKSSAEQSARDRQEDITDTEESPEEKERRLSRARVQAFFDGDKERIKRLSREFVDLAHARNPEMRARDESMIPTVPFPDTQNDGEIRKAKSLESVNSSAEQGTRGRQEYIPNMEETTAEQDPRFSRAVQSFLDDDLGEERDEREKDDLRESESQKVYDRMWSFGKPQSGTVVVRGGTADNAQEDAEISVAKIIRESWERDMEDNAEKRRQQALRNKEVRGLFRETEKEINEKTLQAKASPEAILSRKTAEEREKRGGLGREIFEHSKLPKTSPAESPTKWHEYIPGVEETREEKEFRISREIEKADLDNTEEKIVPMRLDFGEWRTSRNHETEKGKQPMRFLSPPIGGPHEDVVEKGKSSGTAVSATENTSRYEKTMYAPVLTDEEMNMFRIRSREARAKLNYDSIQDRQMIVKDYLERQQRAMAGSKAISPSVTAEREGGNDEVGEELSKTQDFSGKEGAKGKGPSVQDAERTTEEKRGLLHRFRANAADMVAGLRGRSATGDEADGQSSAQHLEFKGKEGE